MTRELRSAVAMGMAHIALVVVVAGIVGGAAQARAIELGELQAVPSNVPPYIFRLPLIAPPQGASAIAAVQVRQPPDTIAFVKQQVVELRLRSLTDVELEVSYGGQTLNRLLPTSELQAARRRVEMAPTSHLSLPARAKGRERSFPEALAMPQAPAGASSRSLIELEMEGIRQEIHRLVEPVAPWEGFSPPIWGSAASAITTMVRPMLGGFFIVGAASLIIGYLRQRRAIERERRRHRALTLALRRRQHQLATGVPIHPLRQLPPLSRATSEALAPAPIMRPGRVAKKTRRRFRVWAPSDTRAVTPDHDGERIRLLAQTSPRVPSARAELLEALAQLRGELMRLQGRWPTAVPLKASKVRSGRVSR
jgi:hypothetical protein